MLVGEIRVAALGTTSSQEAPVERALDALQRLGVKHEVGPLGTTIEAETPEALYEAVREVHRAVREAGPRILLNLTIDDRRDKDETAESLVRDVETHTATALGPR